MTRLRHLALVTRSTVYHRVGGMERHTQELVDALRALGWAVTVVTAPLPADPPEVPGVRYQVVPGGSARGYTRAWRAHLAAVVDALHCAEPLAGILSQSTGAAPLLAWAKTRGLPLAMVVHSTARDQLREPWGRHPRAWARRLRAAWAWRENRELLPRVPVLVAVSEAVAQRLQEDLNGRVAVFVLPSGVDGTVFRPPSSGERLRARRRFGMAEDAVWVGYSGRWTTEKGVDRLLRWVEGARWRLALSGAGPLQGAVRRTPGVVAVGALPKAEQAEFLRGLDIFAFPSRHREGLPMAVMEAMASGLPVVAAADAGVAALLDQGRGVLLAEDAGDAAFVQAIRRLSEDPMARAAMGARAAAWAKERFPSWTDGVAKLLERMGLDG
ncbi:MAG: glycosyltransferase family 4 protein [Firmicutes bacterium]|nr:glycosyltransferase family 4 protein [Alicyclobacillaceae bacterium]MCL6497103.1 glycosyltransferase family 4 protein [Bacillota bacterium]